MSRPPILTPRKTVGHATPRVDARERVTGKATYSGDVQLPGMLYGRILRSPHAHANIKRIDVSKAMALPGVKLVLTHENCSIVWGAGSVAGGRHYVDSIKKSTRQRRYVFNNPVRFYGDPVAAVAAVNRHIAEEALRLIDVEYEPLPFVLDQEEALKPESVKIWPEGNLALSVENTAEPEIYRRGNVDEGFRTSDFVFEDRYTTTYVHNAQMEPRVCVASWEGDKLTLYTPTQGTSNCRHDTARDLGLPDEKVRIICQYMGGGFGNKNQNQDVDLITAMLAKQLGAPVKAGTYAQGRFYRRSRPLADHAILQSGRHPRRRTESAAVARIQRHGSVPQEYGSHWRSRALPVRERGEHRLSRVHQPRRFRELPRPGISAGLLRH